MLAGQLKSNDVSKDVLRVAKDRPCAIYLMQAGLTSVLPIIHFRSIMRSYQDQLFSPIGFVHVKYTKGQAQLPIYLIFQTTSMITLWIT